MRLHSVQRLPAELSGSQDLEPDIPTVAQIMVHLVSITAVSMNIKRLRGKELHMQAPLKQNFRCILQKSTDARDQPIGNKREEKSAARAMKGLYPRSG